MEAALWLGTALAPKGWAKAGPTGPAELGDGRLSLGEAGLGGRDAMV